MLPGCDAQNATCLQLEGLNWSVRHPHNTFFDHRSYYSNVSEPTPSECRLGSALRRCIHAFSGLIDLTLSGVFVVDNCALQSRLVASHRRGQTVTSKTTQKHSSFCLQNPPGGANRWMSPQSTYQQAILCTLATCALHPFIDHLSLDADYFDTPTRLSDLLCNLRRLSHLSLRQSRSSFAPFPFHGWTAVSWSSGCSRILINLWAGGLRN